MKRSRIGVVLAVMLMVVAGVGLGIAQAGGDQMAGYAEPGISADSTQATESHQVTGPIETGSVTDQSDVNDLDHSNVPQEGNISQYWGSDNPSN